LRLPPLPAAAGASRGLDAQVSLKLQIFPPLKGIAVRPMSTVKKRSRFLPDDVEFRYEEFPFYWLARVYGIYQLEMEKVLKKLGTDVPARRVLTMLQMHGTVSVSELATHALIKLSTLTRIVQRMREEGLVETRTNAEDARITDVSIAPKGEDLAARIHQATTKIFVKGYQGLTDAQLAKLTELLKVMFHNFAEG
jgi:DNA-binding MarR family transcriptional regulator